MGMAISSCELTYEDNTRLLIVGQIISFENEDLPQLPVDGYASGEFISSFIPLPLFPLTQEDIDLIGSTRLMADGNYKITTISPKNNSYLSLVINAEGEDGYDSGWPTLVINGIKSLPLETFKYQIPEVEIGRVVNSRLQINRISNIQDTLAYLIQYNASVKEINIDHDMFEVNIWQMKEYGELYPSELTKEIPLRVSRGDSIQVSYSLINNGIVKQDDSKVHYNKEINGCEFDF